MLSDDPIEREKRIFMDALALSGSQRDAFLRTRCGHDPGLLGRLERLLAVHDRVGRDPGADFLEPEDQTTSAPGLEGRRVGRFRVIRLIAAGGMGEVYEADQDQPRRRVALKIIRPGLASRQLLARFSHEADVLGRLQHPGVAQIHEAGIADMPHGRQPYFAMELVQGLPVTRHARDTGMDTPARLELVARICDAVHHAHQKGVIHRDLKPANILVDASGQPKVLDFGVARVTDGDVKATTFHTGMGQLVGTLAYMSPEQIGGDSGELDTRSDVYALGVIAYELILQRPPYALDGATLTEAARVISDTVPIRPSSVDARVDGDIDTILLKALEKDKERRYASASDLAMDIRRYLRNEPIAARPTSTWYHARKFIRRNRTLVAGLFLAFAGLVTGAAFATWKAWEATQERNRAREAELAAREEATVANAESSFMLTVFRGPDPENLGGKKTSVEDLLRTAAAEVGKVLGSLPAAEVRVRVDIATTFSNMALYDEAEEQLRKALAVSTHLHGKDDPRRAVIVHKLGQVRYHQGDDEEAGRLFSSAMEVLSRSGPEHSSELASLFSDMALRELRVGDIPAAADLQRNALAVHRTSGAGDIILARHLNTMGMILRRDGDLGAAAAHYREALAIYEATEADVRADTARTLNNLSVVARLTGQLAEAIDLAARSLRIRRELYGDTHPAVALAIYNMAQVLEQHGDLDAAEKMFSDSVVIFRAAYGEAHQDVARALAGFAGFLQRRERFEECDSKLTEAIAMLTDGLQIRNGALLIKLLELRVRTLEAVGRPEEAETVRTRLKELSGQ